MRPSIDKGEYSRMVERALATRASPRPIVFVDIAVPRDVEDAVRTLPDVHLFGIDDLRHRIDTNLADRHAEIPRVDQIIDEELDAFRTRRSEARVRPIISALRAKAEEIRRREMERFAQRHASAADITHADVEHLTQAIVNKLLHDPTTRIRRNADHTGHVEYERIVRQLFGLD